MPPDTAIQSAAEPIIATVVPPPPSPYQFGLKALMGLMVVCSVQFALMSYLGVIQGMLVGIGISGVALTAILAYAVLFVRSRSPLMERLDYVGIRLVVAIWVLIVGSVLAGGGATVFSTLQEIRTAVNLERQIGMQTIRAEVWDSKKTRYALKVVAVFPGGIASRAGIQPGEVIVLDGRVQEFYERMDENRGKSYSFTVSAPPAGGGSIENSPKRQVTIVVPK